MFLKWQDKQLQQLVNKVVILNYRQWITCYFLGQSPLPFSQCVSYGWKFLFALVYESPIMILNHNILSITDECHLR